MGFGTLFIGYFLLLNITAPGISDIIAALVMLLGLYRLRRINSKFQAGFIVDVCFSGFALVELVLWSLDIMKMFDVTAITPYTGMIRSLLVAVLTIAVLMGIHDVAKEVELEKLPTTASVMTYISLAVFGIAILMEAPMLISWLPPLFYSVFGIIAVLGSFVVIIINLTVIYNAYACICMPSDQKKAPKNDNEGEGFLAAFRRRKAEREREDAEYRAEVAKRKEEERKGK